MLIETLFITDLEMDISKWKGVHGMTRPSFEKLGLMMRIVLLNHPDDLELVEDSFLWLNALNDAGLLDLQ